MAAQRIPTFAGLRFTSPVLKMARSVADSHRGRLDPLRARLRGVVRHGGGASVSWWPFEGADVQFGVDYGPCRPASA